MKKSAVILTALAVLLVAAGAVIRFVLLPSVQQVPSDLDSTTKYTGTVTMLNAAALATGDGANLFLTDVPITGTQQVKVTSTSGTTAVMSSDIELTGPDGSTLLGSQHVYALDRVTLDAAAAPEGSEGVEPHQGLALGFPLQPEAKDYRFWDSTTQTASLAKYTSTEEFSGRTAFIFEFSASGPVKDPATLQSLPPALPKVALTSLAAGLPAEMQQALAQFLPALPDPIELSYASDTKTTLWVDSATGVVLDVDQAQTITASMASPAGPVPLTEVFDLELGYADETVTDRSDSAASAERSLTLIGTFAPLALGGLGVLLLVIAIFLFARRRPATTETPAVS